MDQFIKWQIIILALIFSPVSMAQATKEMTTYANADFADYKKSGASNQVWDDFVKEGFEAIDKENATSAIEFLRKASNLGCQSPIVSFKLAIAYEAMGAHYSAIQYYELAKEQFKKINTTHRYAIDLDNNLARALFSMGQVDKATEILARTCGQSCSAWGLKLLAHHSLAQNDINKTATYLDQLLQHQDSGLSEADKKELTQSLARIYAGNDQQEKANKYYQSLGEMDPSNTESQRYLKKKSKPKAIPNDAQWKDYDKIFDLLDNK